MQSGMLTSDFPDLFEFGSKVKNTVMDERNGNLNLHIMLHCRGNYMSWQILIMFQQYISTECVFRFLLWLDYDYHNTHWT